MLLFSLALFLFAYPHMYLFEFDRDAMQYKDTCELRLQNAMSPTEICYECETYAFA